MQKYFGCILLCNFPQATEYRARYGIDTEQYGMMLFLLMYQILCCFSFTTRQLCGSDQFVMRP